MRAAWEAPSRRGSVNDDSLSEQRASCCRWPLIECNEAVSSLNNASGGATWQIEQIRSFFDVLSHKLALQRQALQRLDRFLSTQFNVFHYIRPGELMLSRILADLLSPGGSHGQGDLFLRAFVQRLPVRPAGDYESVRVLTEERTISIANFVRRHDLLLDFGDYGISIENKPSAAEQHNQVADYLLDLEARFGPNHCLVYLTALGREPTSIDAFTKARSLKSKRLVLMSYSADLRGWINECIRLCESDKFRWFLREFLEYVVEAYPSSPSLETASAG